MKNKINEFNIVIVGVGGQGLLTILQIIAQASLSQGYEVRTSELHGLAQRGGSVEAHIRFGKRIFSPLVSGKKADLIIALEAQEALRGSYFANAKTKLLVNRRIVPIPLPRVPLYGTKVKKRTQFSSLKPLKEEEILNLLKKISQDVNLIPAGEICQKSVGTDVAAGIYLLALAVFKDMLPLESDSVILAIKKIIPEKYLELNLKVFELARP